MNIDLKPYQEKAVNQLIETTVKLLGYDGPGEVCVFQAPTGSGKTIMMAKYIESLIKELPKDDFCFVWMSIGKGELHLQSKHSLEKVFAGFPRVTSVEDAFSGGRERIVQNEVVVANWEKLRSKERQSGDWKNLIMKDGEKLNFRDVLEKTREQRKIILIIDESHVSADTARANELRDLIGADVVIEMSATPRRPQQELGFTQELARGGAGYVIVEPKDVIDEGMIKKEIIINEDIEKIAASEDDSQSAVLEATYRKRLELKKVFEKEGSHINPLVLVQIPTAEAGDQKIEAVKKFLAGKNIVERKDGHGNGKLAIWLAEQKSELIDWIAEPDNEIEFLIFKQAIDTGWDCPRAHILVKFRETHNIVFEIQTVGRILRMPEQKHYGNEALNRGYIYTNLKSIEVKKEEYNPNIIKHLKATRIKEYKPIKIESYYKSRADYGDVTSSFGSVFEKIANDYFGIKKGDKTKDNIKTVEAKGINLDIKKYQQELIADTAVDVKSFDELEGKINADAMAKLNVAVDELQIFFEQVVKNNLGPFKNIKRSVPAVKTAIYIWFNNTLGAEDWSDPSLLTQQIFLHTKNRVVFEHVLAKAIGQYVFVKEQEVRERVEESEQRYAFELPIESFYNEHTDEIVKVKNYAFEPCYLNTDRSNPEREFETFLNTNASKIDWWWKNGENKQDYFGIKYEYAGSISTFYPDYLVKLSDGRFGLLEVKDTGDRDGKTYTKAKAEALQKYITNSGNKKLFGGIVIERNKAWLINENLKYDWEKYENGDWSDWDEMKL
ncbi:MAG: Type III restriction enzyme, res subunit [Parcubacteria group bacterium GW2011_GWF2_40_10]|uniref:Type III restriction enzyme, res subunit n=1 Tax=Candidatus Nomurabacteria bacterium GW2011_GWD2_39_12 TaxID=1618759 RepID=A0A837HM49_9BACT|nr:MAG: Type III restriction enzyme, res subunit [Candidatus Nomurabacteria bacterium GW2011_GWD2_39_12]KKR38246.1 MAG: Type III restriction enzyme, res subunit [Parcubacteria group bacterium GW2011_GWF2_40_10]KKR76930.1 MAG: Type III restriction enzyme, res subunit [Parcubacteria group bacterium GW2011_GWE2_40_8]